MEIGENFLKKFKIYRWNRLTFIYNDKKTRNGTSTRKRDLHQLT